MAIVATDIQYRLSGGAANTSPAASLGGAKSSTQVTGSVVFDAVQGAEATSGDVEYRVLYVHNAHATLTLQNAKAWISANTPSPDTVIHIAVGSSVVNGTEPTLADENTPPTGLTFTTAPTNSEAVLLGNIPPGQHRAIVLRRTVTAGAVERASDTATVSVWGES